MLNILTWIIFGALAGWIAALILRTGNEGDPMLLNILMGILGAIIGGLIVRSIGLIGVTGINIFGLFTAIVGAIVLLFGYRIVHDRSVR